MTAAPAIPAATAGALPGALPQEPLPELLRLFNDVGARLQDTHRKLESRVAELQRELGEAQERLRRSRALASLGEMAAGIAHEIRNPLASIALHAEVLAEDLSERPAQRELVEKISRATARLDSIVRDVLRFARDMRLEVRRVPLREPVVAAIEACEASLAAAGIRPELALPVDLEVSADPGLLAQAVSNVVRNAVEAMEGTAAGARTLRVEGLRSHRLSVDGRRQGVALLRVTDAGPGVPADAIEHLFNPFFTTRAEGTGLGLAIVHRIVDAHGGGVSIRNLARGACVEFVLPLDGPAASPTAGEAGLDAAVTRRLGARRGGSNPGARRSAAR